MNWSEENITASKKKKEGIKNTVSCCFGCRTWLQEVCWGARGESTGLSPQILVSKVQQPYQSVPRTPVEGEEEDVMVKLKTNASKHKLLLKTLKTCLPLALFLIIHLNPEYNPPTPSFHPLTGLYFYKCGWRCQHGLKLIRWHVYNLRHVSVTHHFVRLFYHVT